MPRHEPPGQASDLVINPTLEGVLKLKWSVRNRGVTELVVDTRREPEFAEFILALARSDDAPMLSISPALLERMRSLSILVEADEAPQECCLDITLCDALPDLVPMACTAQSLRLDAELVLNPE